MGVEVFHLIGAGHSAHFRPQVTATDILIPVARVKDGLNAYHTLAFHFPVFAIGIKNIPMSSVQFYRETIMVFDGNAVREHVFSRHGIGIIGLIKGFHTYLYTLCGYTVHSEEFD